METIILSRISSFGEKKNNAIPVNQAGFGEGRSAIDHLVKLTTQIKKAAFEEDKCVSYFFWM